MGHVYALREDLCASTSKSRKIHSFRVEPNILKLKFIFPTFRSREFDNIEQHSIGARYRRDIIRCALQSATR